MRTPRGIERRTAARLMVLAGVAVAAVGGLYAAMVRTARGQAFEEAVLDGASRLPFGAGFSPTGRVGAVSVASIAVVLLAAVAVAVARGRPRLAAAVVVMTGGALTTVWTLQHVVLPRPGLVPTTYAEGRNSFPSNHTAVGMVLAAAVLMVVPLRLRPWGWVVVGLFGATFGVSTVVAGLHRPSDVLAGHLVVVAWACVTAALLVVWRGSSDVGDPPPRGVRGPLCALGAAVVLPVLAGAVWFLVAHRIDPADVAGRNQARFAAAVCVLVGEAAAVSAAMLLLFRGLSLDPPLRGELPERQVPWVEIDAGDAAEQVTGLGR